MKKTLTLLLLALGLTTARAQQSPEEKFNMAMYAITQMYVDSIPKAQYVDEQIARMLQQLDPFSEYLPPVTAADNEMALTGTVTAPTQGATTVPAQDATTEKTGDEQPRLAPIGYRTVKSHYMADTHTGYINLTMFAEQTLDEFREAVSELKDKKMKNLILDLRNNGGGLFDVAVALADELLDGDKLIVTTRGAHVPTQEFRAKEKGCWEKGRLILLVGEQTKSAAEIFAAAISDWGRGILIGHHTFGKGLIQETLPFSDGSALRITVARYLTPSGKTISQPDGVVADIDVASDDSYVSEWYALLTYAGVQTAVARKYVDDLREKLLAKYPTAEKFIAGFQTPDELMAALLQTAEQAGIPTDEAARQKADGHLRAQLKAVVCSKLYQDNNLYYRLFNERQREVRRALEVAGGKEYDQIIQGKLSAASNNPQQKSSLAK